MLSRYGGVATSCLLSSLAYDTCASPFYGRIAFTFGIEAGEFIAGSCSLSKAILSSLPAAAKLPEGATDRSELLQVQKVL